MRPAGSSSPSPEIELGQRATIHLAIAALVAHRAEQPAAPHAHLDLAAHLARKRHGRVGIVHAVFQAMQIERDAAARSGHIHHHADRAERAIGRRRIARFKDNIGQSGSSRHRPVEARSPGRAGSAEMNTCLLMSVMPVLAPARCRAKR
jgi:hypothetical protein